MQGEEEGKEKSIYKRNIFVVGERYVQEEWETTKKVNIK